MTGVSTRKYPKFRIFDVRAADVVVYYDRIRTEDRSIICYRAICRFGKVGRYYREEMAGMAFFWFAL
jgi:hypothetical protein